MGSINCSVPNILQIILFVFSRRTKIHTSLEKLEGEQMMTEFNFLANYPFNKCVLLRTLLK